MAKTLKQGRAKILFVLVVGIGLCFAFCRWAYDDPFITFRYAENLRRGLGFVYNPGERVLSTTAPLYALLLAALSHVWTNLPHLSNLISALSLGLGGVLLYEMGRHWERPVAGIVAAALFPFFPLMVNTFGAETCFYVMLSLGAFASYAGKRVDVAMVLAALATLTRSDGVLVAVVLAGHLLLVERRIPWRPVVLFGLVVAPWYLFSWAYFGSPFPVTLAAKQHQGQMAVSDSFAQGFLGVVRNYGRHPAYWAHGALALLGLGYALARAREWLPLFAWGPLYFASYALLGVSRYFWYYAPLVAVVVAAVGLGVAAIWEQLPLWITRGWRGAALLVAMVAILLCPQARGLWFLRKYPDQRAGIYREVGCWLNENTPSDASVGTLEVGIIGYYARRRMVDFAGLIQPAVARQMGRNTTYEDTALWAVQRYRPDYLVLGDGWFPALKEEVVSPRCETLQTFTDEDYSGTLIVYRCRWHE